MAYMNANSGGIITISGGIITITVFCGAFYGALSEIISKDLKIASAEIRGEVKQFKDETRGEFQDIRREYESLRI
jgi:hypothetical protein